MAGAEARAEAAAVAAAAVVRAVVGAALLALAAAALCVDSLGAVYVTGPTGSMCNVVKISWSASQMYAQTASDVFGDVAGVSNMLIES
jgi:uncharacterized protein YaaW (UPF0174 family)